MYIFPRPSGPSCIEAGPAPRVSLRKRGRSGGGFSTMRVEREREREEGREGEREREREGVSPLGGASPTPRKGRTGHCPYIHTYTRTCTHTNSHTLTYTDTHIHTHTLIHVRTYTSNIHTYTHTHTPTHIAHYEHMALAKTTSVLREAMLFVEAVNFSEIVPPFVEAMINELCVRLYIRNSLYSCAGYTIISTTYVSETY